MMTNNVHSSRYQSGYTLVELAISLTIIAMLISGGMAMFANRSAIVMANETVDRLQLVQEALHNYVKEHGHLPCPAATAGVKSTDPAYGQPSGYNVVGAATVAQRCGVIEGMLPIRPLNPGTSSEVQGLKIPPEYAYDSWGRRFTYRIATGFGNSGDFANPAYRGDIAIEDIYGNQRTDIQRPAPNNIGAAYVIVSFGGNGAGAYTKDGTQISPAGAVGREVENADNAANAIYVQGDRTTSFDDIVGFETKSQLSNRVRLSAPLMPSSTSCAAAAAIINQGAPQSGKSNQLDALIAAGYTAAQARIIYDSAVALQRMCENPPVNACAATPDLLPSAPYLALWYDADDLSTLTYDAATKVVSEWRDKAQSLDITAPTPARRPFIVLQADEGAWNGRNVLFFNGGMTLRRDIVDAKAFADSDAVTVFVAGRYATTAGGVNRVPFAWNYGGVNVVSLALPAAGGGLDWRFGAGSLGTGRISAALPAEFTDQWHVTTAIRSDMDNNSRLYLDGTLLPTGTATDTVPTGAPQELAISPVGGEFSGNIGEILVYRRALTDNERRDVEAYLLQKWRQPGYSYCYKNGDATENSCMTGMKKGADALNVGTGCFCMAHQISLSDVKTNPRYFAPCITPTFLTAGENSASAFSPEGINWTAINGNRIFSSGHVTAIASNSRKVWVAIGTDEQIATSNNGNDWVVRRAVASGDTLRAIDHNPRINRWIAVGDNGTIYGSDDNGESWDALDYPTPPTLWDGTIDAYGISYSYEKDMWIIVGEGGRVLYSDTALGGGQNWADVADSSTAGSIIGNGNTLRAVAYRTNPNASERYWVAVGDNGAVAYSVNGSSGWNSLPSPVWGGTNLRAVAVDPITHYIAITGGDRAGYSTSAATWTMPAAPLFGGGVNVRGIAYDKAGNRWVAVGDDGRVAYSATGVTAYQTNGVLGWTTTTAPVGANDLWAVGVLK